LMKNKILMIGISILLFCLFYMKLLCLRNHIGIPGFEKYQLLNLQVFGIMKKLKLSKMIEFKIKLKKTNELYLNNGNNLRMYFNNIQKYFQSNLLI